MSGSAHAPNADLRCALGARGKGCRGTAPEEPAKGAPPLSELGRDAGSANLPDGSPTGKEAQPAEPIAHSAGAAAVPLRQPGGVRGSTPIAPLPLPRGSLEGAEGQGEAPATAVRECTRTERLSTPGDSRPTPRVALPCCCWGAGSWDCRWEGYLGVGRALARLTRRACAWPRALRRAERVPFGGARQGVRVCPALSRLRRPTPTASSSRATPPRPPDVPVLSGGSKVYIVSGYWDFLVYLPEFPWGGTALTLLGQRC